MDGDDPLSQWRMRRMQELQSAAARPPSPEGPAALGASDFDAFLAQHRLVMVDFWARWCGPCHQMAPVVDELAREWQGHIAVAKVDTDKDPDLAMRYRVSGIPAFVFFRDGQVIGRVVGVNPPQTFRQIADELRAESA